LFLAVAHGFKVLQTAVPTVEADESRDKTALFGRCHHVPEVLVLGLAVFEGLVIDAAVAGETCLSIGPQQREQVDAPNNTAMLTTPMSGDQFDVPSVWLVL
jgi:hypothetical protein